MILKIGLMEGRHALPFNEFVFNRSTIDWFTQTNRNIAVDVDTVEQIAYYRIWLLADKQGLTELVTNCDEEEVSRIKGGVICHLYVTGLSPVLIATINALHEWGVKVILYHFSKDTEEYFPQEVI